MKHVGGIGLPTFLRSSVTLAEQAEHSGDQHSGVQILMFSEFSPFFYGPVTSWAPAATLVGIQRAHLEAAGRTNLQHNTALHIMLLHTVLCPLGVWKNPLLQQPVVIAQDWAGCAGGTRGLGLQLWIALLPHSFPCCLCCR